MDTQIYDWTISNTPRAAVKVDEYVLYRTASHAVDDGERVIVRCKTGEDGWVDTQMIINGELDEFRMHARVRINFDLSKARW